jgi:uncharacterized protein
VTLRGGGAGGCANNQSLYAGPGRGTATPCRLPELRQKRIKAIVNIVFDPAKDAVNRAKHGVSLALAEVLFAGPHVTVTDDRFDYGEAREIGFGLVHRRLFVCVYVDRNDERRVISLRKANRREVMRYGEEIE